MSVKMNTNAMRMEQLITYMREFLEQQAKHGIQKMVVLVTVDQNIKSYAFGNSVAIMLEGTGIPTVFGHGKRLEDAWAEIEGNVAKLPLAWREIDVARTLGLPMNDNASMAAE